MSNTIESVQETDDLKLDSLEIKDHSYDQKIDALNVFAIVSVQDYLEIAEKIKSNNELQRKKIANNSTVYALLKEDMLNGCLIPAIVLALDETNTSELPNTISHTDYEEVKKSIRRHAFSLKLLDGLQRTNIMLDLQTELVNTEKKTEDQIARDEVKLGEFYSRQIRLEVYLKINRFGILYRMLTLNTGQTPMSLRHQIEILYSDYYIKEKDGIVLIREAFESTKPVKLGQYKFSDVIEGVTSYIDGSEFSLDRFDLLNYIKSLKRMSEEDTKEDIFDAFLTTYHLFLQALTEKSEGWQFNYEALTAENLSFFPVISKDKNEDQVRVSPFGNNAQQIFLKSQAFTGLGAALSSLKVKDRIKSIEQIKEYIPSLKFNSTPNNALDTLVVRLEQIRRESRKIGESQRTFFKHFFTSLFNSNNDDAFQIIEEAVESAFKKTI